MREENKKTIAIQNSATERSAKIAINLEKRQKNNPQIAKSRPWPPVLDKFKDETYYP
jgi:hypothetical protein